MSYVTMKFKKEKYIRETFFQSYQCQCYMFQYHIELSYIFQYTLFKICTHKRNVLCHTNNVTTYSNTRGDITSKAVKMRNVIQHSTTFESAIPYIALDTVTSYNITLDTARPYNVAHDSDSDTPISVIFGPARPMTITHPSASYLTALHIYSDTTYQHYIWPC
jgi:hypothetical protein